MSSIHQYPIPVLFSSPDGSAFRITGDETTPIEDETPLLCGARATQQGADDLQIHHPTFGVRSLIVL